MWVRRPGVVSPFVLGIAFLLLLWAFPATMVYMGMASCVLGILADALLSFARARDFDTGTTSGEFLQAVFPDGYDPTRNDRHFWFMLGILLSVVCVGLAALSAALRRKLPLVVGVLKVRVLVSSQWFRACGVCFRVLVVVCSGVWGQRPCSGLRIRA
jgi:hypothetical protein